MDIKQALTIPYYSNMTCQILGLDSPNECFDPVLFQQYPEQIDYQFNELGFRDCSYKQYQGNEILAIGDSFTLGLGVNAEQIWPSILSKLLDYPVRNFSLNGASNDWMSRKTLEILNFFRPRAIVVHYSFSHRRENPFHDWHDDERTECEPMNTDQENLDNWEKNYQIFNNLSIPVIHSFITDWDTTGVDYKSYGPNMLPPIKKLDLARDGFHYGIKTHSVLARALANITSPLVDELHQSLGS